MSASLVLAAALIQTPPQGPATTVQPPAPRRSVAGLQGFDSVSTLVFAETPDHPHRLRATYAFPDRVRWQLTLAEESKGEHEIRYRFGDGIFVLREGSRESEECTGTEREEMRLAMELRRALVLFPDGFDWKESEGGRKADLGEVGALLARASSPSDARPSEMRAVTHDGRIVDVFQGISWREKNGRSWPAALELWRSGNLVWKETIDSIDVEGKVIDAFFLPVDRRAATGTAMPIEEAREQELPASCAMRVEAPKGASWKEIASGYRKLREEWTERLRDRGLVVDPHATVEIDEKGAPIAWIVRLDPVPETPPSGFAHADARRGVALAVASLESIRAEKLAVLARSVPAGSKAGNAYVRFLPDPSKVDAGGRALIVLPYTPLRKG